MLELAKRVFTGAKVLHGPHVRFVNARRQVEDLLWLMQRFPLEMDDKVRLALLAARDGAIKLCQDREGRVERAVPQPADFIGELKDFQRVGVAHLMDNPKTLLGDDMGLGKTVMGLAGAAQIGRWPAIVVTESMSVCMQWARMSEIFLKPQETPWAHVIKGTRVSTLPKARLYVLHYGLLRHWADELCQLEPELVIFDEVQNLRHAGTQKYSSASAISDRCGYVWGLSGTPIYGYGVECWYVMNAIDHLCLGALEGFTREWCSGYGGKIIQDPERLGAYLKREGLLLRRLKKDVAKDLPPKHRVVHALEHNKGEYNKLIGNAIRLAGGYSAAVFEKKGQLLRQIDQETRLASGLAKADFVAEFVVGLIDAGEPVVLFLHHHAVHDRVKEAIERRDRRVTHEQAANPVMITGAQTLSQKQAAVESFVSGQSKIILIGLRNTAGLDGLQKRPAVVVFGELDWSPAVHSQAEDRLHRMEMIKRDSVMCYYLVTRTASDEIMQEALGLKVGQFAGIMGDGGASTEENDQALVAAERHMTGIIERLTQNKRERRGKKSTQHSDPAKLAVEGLAPGGVPAVGALP